MIPKHVILHDAPEHLWGVARLRAPVILAEMHLIGENAFESVYQPIIWPADVIGLTTENKFHRALTALWHCFGSYADDGARAEMYVFDLTRELPRFLVADNDESDFTGVIDTGHGLLWAVSADCRSLNLCDWRMHPAMPPLPPDVSTAARLAREAGDFWLAFILKQNELSS